MANRFLVCSTGAATWDATTTTNWSTSSGGAGGASVPTSSDAVIMDNNSVLFSGQTIVTVTGARAMASLDMSAVTNHVLQFTDGGSGELDISGNLKQSSVAGTGDSGAGGIVIKIKASCTLTPSTRPLGAAGSSIDAGTTILVGDATVGSGVNTIASGATLDLNGHEYSITSALTINSGGTLTLGSGILDVGASLTNNGTLTVSSGTLAASGTVTLALGGITVGALTVSDGCTATITGANTFTNTTIALSSVAATLILQHGVTQIFTNPPTLTGVSGHKLTINSDSAGSRATVSCASGTISGSFLDIKDSAATGGATWNAANSTDSGNNTGWNFASLQAQACL